MQYEIIETIGVPFDKLRAGFRLASLAQDDKLGGGK